MTDERVKEVLSKGSYVAAEDLARAEAAAEKTHTPLADYLLAEGVITNDLLGQAIAEASGVPYADLNHAPPSREQVLKIPEAIARKYRVVIGSEDERHVTIGTDAPEKKPELTNALEPLFKKKKVMVAYALPQDIDEAFLHYRKPLTTRFSEILGGKTKAAPELFEEILEDALAYRASDVHFEPQEREVAIRFRIDGVLHEAGRLPRENYENILNRIKVLARLRIDEHFAAQDGALRYRPHNRESFADLRVSIAPTLDGEKTVIRVLAEYVRRFTLADLGLSSAHQAALAAAGRKPFGMVLVTGPTGSGKTTTLYALVKTLNRPEVNITTIEDPVEYKITGINQMQVNPQTNLTFAKGLRSIIRQDPNIILVGEIRDEETAEIAVNAALTGHLLFSTFHANDAPTAIPRLLDMGIEPFLLASTLEVVIGQRLVRRICESCRYSEVVPAAKLERMLPGHERYFSEPKTTFYRGKGCKTCSETGYRGRMAIFEFITVSPELEELILKRPSTKEIWELATHQGSRSLFEDGILKVKNGITTLEELLRVATPPAPMPAKRPLEAAARKRS